MELKKDRIELFFKFKSQHIIVGECVIVKVALACDRGVWGVKNTRPVVLRECADELAPLYLFQPQYVNLYIT